MNRTTASFLRTASLLLTSTVAALGSFLGLRALAQDASTAPGAALAQPANPTTVNQPRFVNPTAAALLGIVHQALSNNGLAERIFRDPDAVAAEFQLSSNERLVLRQMTRAQFQVARAD